MSPLEETVLAEMRISEWLWSGSLELSSSFRGLLDCKEERGRSVMLSSLSLSLIPGVIFKFLLFFSRKFFLLLVYWPNISYWIIHILGVDFLDIFPQDL